MKQQLSTECQFYEGAFSATWKQINSIFGDQFHCQVEYA